MTPKAKAITFDNTYLSLPSDFYAPAKGSRAPSPELVIVNRQLAQDLGLDLELLTSTEGLQMLSGSQLPTSSAAIAMAYAGHQYGSFTGLGDGRALLLGEYVSPDGLRWDFHLKGSGPTAYSRRGDGKAALGPMLREYLISEAMHHLGIPTSRSLGVVSTGELIQRDTIEVGAVLTRVASSHLRIGTFQYASALAYEDSSSLNLLKSLADYAIKRHYPDLLAEAKPYLALYEAIIDRQSALVAQWQQVGFVHGVLNTDNTTISGETLDYGPCAFMDHYHPSTVFSSIDRYGRYAYGQQPNIIGWNLARLAEAMAPLFDADLKAAQALAQAAIGRYPAKFQAAYHYLFCKKLGLDPGPGSHGASKGLIDDLLALLQANALDFTQAFLALTLYASKHPMTLQFMEGFEVLNPWIARWEALRGSQGYQEEQGLAIMQAHNPCVIPRNQWVEGALRDFVNRGSGDAFHDLLALLEKPYAYTESQLAAAYAFKATKKANQNYRTYCGT